MNRELPDVQAGFRKGRGTKHQIANIRWIIEKAREFQKNIYFLFNDYAKAFHCVNCNKVWKILKEMGILEHFTCLLKNLYAGQVGKLKLDMNNWFKIEKGVRQRLAYLTSMHSTSCEMPGWMNHNVESRLPEEISTTSDMQMIPL